MGGWDRWIDGWMEIINKNGWVGQRVNGWMHEWTSVWLVWFV